MDRVFEAWSYPPLIQQWLAPPGCSVVHATWDFQPGGHLRVDIADEAGALVHAGNFIDIKPQQRIVFTWHSLYTADGPCTVTVDFETAAEGTQVSISSDSRDCPDTANRVDWPRILDSLARFVGQEGP